MKTRAFIIILFIFFFEGGLYSQQLSLRWAQQFGGTGWDYVSHIQQTTTGNFLLVGSMKGCIPGDTLHPYLQLSNNGWMAVCDSNGSLIWQKVFGGQYFDNITSIIPGTNRILIAGLFQDTLKFDSLEVVSESFTSAYLSEVNEQGNLTWLRKIGGKAFISNILIEMSNTGDYYLAGSFRDSLVLAGNLQAISGESGIFLTHLQANGEETSPIVIKCTGNTNLGGLCSHDSLICITGSFTDTLWVGDTALVSLGEKDIFAILYNQTGDIKWIHTYGGMGNDNSAAITFSNNGDLAMTGYFEDAALFDNSIIESVGGKDIYLAVFTPSGSLTWIKSIGGISDDYGYCLAYDEDNELFVSGSFINTIHLPDENGNMVEIEATSAFGNAFIAKYNSAGILKASYNLPGTSEDYCRSLIVKEDIVTAAGNFYRTLQFQDSIGQTINIQSSGEKDIFMVQFRDMCSGFTVYAGADTSVCAGQSIYLSTPADFPSWQWFPDGESNQNIEITNAGTYSLTVTNYFGCIASDTVTINLASVPQVFAGNDTLIEPGDLLTLNSATVSNADVLHWETSGDGYFFNNEQLNTNYSLSYTDISAGSILLTLIANNYCASVSDSLVLSLPIEEDGIIVYPNPANGPVTLVCREGMTIQTITITKQTGEVLESNVPVNNIVYQYNLSPYPPGTYLFHITTSESYVTKVVNKL